MSSRYNFGSILVTTSSKSTHFEDDKIVVELAHQPQSRVEATVTVRASWMPELAKAAYDKVRKQVSLPGFRKGKVPAALIEKQFGKAIEQEWKDIVCESALMHAISLTGVQAVRFELGRHLSVHPKHLTSRDEEAVIVYTFDVIPAAIEIEPKKLTVELPEKKAVDAAMIEEQINAMRTTYARMARQGEDQANIEPLTDEELCKFLSVENLDPIRKEVEKMMQNRFDVEWTQERSGRVLQALFDEYPLDLPKSLEEASFKQYSAIVGYRLERFYGIDTKSKTFAEQKTELQKQSHDRLRAYFTLVGYATKHGLEPNEQDIAKGINEFCSFIRQEEFASQVEFLRSVQIGDFCKVNLLIDRAVEDLLTKVKVKESSAASITEKEPLEEKEKECCGRNCHSCE